MHLIPVSVEVIKNESNIKHIPKRVSLTLCIEVIGSGDFTEYVTGNEMDAEKLAVSILNGQLIISPNHANIEEQKTVLTIQKVKDCIGFEKGSLGHKILSELLDTHYDIYKGQGATDEDAAKMALHDLGNHLTQIGRAVGHKS